MTRPKETTPTHVPETATQAGEIRARWAWVEPSVWTDRMLAALERGVKGGVWFSHRTVFGNLDGWVRMRLRSLLRRRRGLRGRGRGADHPRWPNAFFAERGLFSLKTAHALAVQSSRR